MILKDVEIFEYLNIWILNIWILNIEYLNIEYLYAAASDCLTKIVGCLRQTTVEINFYEWW